MHIKLPPLTTQPGPSRPTPSPHRHEPPARDLKPTGRTNLSRRPTAAPRRSGY
ncbi:hypothetical protein [Nonomuraea gerenzanensis]|uniref:hypothetical protein n=1 Tax=Nonomuraea gerenzanensis TaxID=93944 RepID=UPI001CD96737|nr:hypothetical protein [Nonomuraea gerenzanensis]UBU12499.1 hypothetical protein LCN96_50900 [Nonomuraea gerenzanensis]